MAHVETTAGMLDQMEELLRETFEGAKPGEGTQYLDKDGGIRQTLAQLTAAQAGRSRDGHPSIAAHVRHMIFHLRVSHEWIRGDHSKRDWLGSFQPFAVTDAEWETLKQEIERERETFIEVMRALPDAQVVENGAGMGTIAHLAYHLGAIRQLLHDVQVRDR
jgi:hypothetical protein